MCLQYIQKNAQNVWTISCFSLECICKAFKTCSNCLGAVSPECVFNTFRTTFKMFDSSQKFGPECIAFNPSFDISHNQHWQLYLIVSNYISTVILIHSKPKGSALHHLLVAPIPSSVDLCWLDFSYSLHQLICADFMKHTGLWCCRCSRILQSHPSGSVTIPLHLAGSVTVPSGSLLNGPVTNRALINVLIVF